MRRRTGPTDLLAFTGESTTRTFFITGKRQDGSPVSGLRQNWYFSESPAAGGGPGSCQGVSETSKAPEPCTWANRRAENGFLVFLFLLQSWKTLPFWSFPLYAPAPAGWTARTPPLTAQHCPGELQLSLVQPKAAGFCFFFLLGEGISRDIWLQISLLSETNFIIY